MFKITAEDYRSIVGALSGNRNLNLRGPFCTACYWILLAIFGCIGIFGTIFATIIFGSLIPLVSFLPMLILGLVVGCVYRYWATGGVSFIDLIILSSLKSESNHLLYHCCRSINAPQSPSSPTHHHHSCLWRHFIIIFSHCHSYRNLWTSSSSWS